MTMPSITVALSSTPSPSLALFAPILQQYFTIAMKLELFTHSHTLTPSQSSLAQLGIPLTDVLKVLVAILFLGNILFYEAKNQELSMQGSEGTQSPLTHTHCIPHPSSLLSPFSPSPRPSPLFPSLLPSLPFLHSSFLLSQSCVLWGISLVCSLNSSRGHSHSGPTALGGDRLSTQLALQLQ